MCAPPLLKPHMGMNSSGRGVGRATLFSAICQIWAQFYGSQDLSQFLTRFGQGDPPLLLTSAFPFIGQHRLFPKPEKLNWNQIEVQEKQLKQLKRVRFLSTARFQQLVENHPLEFQPEKDLINQNQVWIDSRTELLARDQLIWQTQVRPRVTIDRLSSASSIFS